MLHEMKVGRVSRALCWGSETGWKRTSNRRDFAIEPPRPVLTNDLQNAGVHTRAIGKIGDIFSMQGIDHCVKGDDETLMAALDDHVRPPQITVLHSQILSNLIASMDIVVMFRDMHVHWNGSIKKWQVSCRNCVPMIC